MAAKLTIIFFILICFEIGFLLIILPWLPQPSWSENFLLIWIVEKLQWHSFGRIVASGYFKGAVTGLGLFNIVIGLREIINFNQTVRAFQVKWQSEEPQPK
jgi:hypothetical protein